MTNQLFSIKPPQWERYESDGQVGFKAKTLLGELRVYQWKGEPQWLYWHPEQFSVSVASPEKGKQLAEDRWQAYIRQGLEPYGPAKVLERGYAEPIEPVVWDAEDEALASDGTPTADSIRRAAEKIAHEMYSECNDYDVTEAGISKIETIIKAHIGAES